MRHVSAFQSLRPGMFLEGGEQTTIKKTYTKILDKVIEDTEALGVFTVLDVDQGANFGSLHKR
jgi:hypothetical protein